MRSYKLKVRVSENEYEDWGFEDLPVPILAKVAKYICLHLVDAKWIATQESKEILQDILKLVSR